MTDSAKHTPGKFKFERILRKCPHNESLTRDGVTRGFIYDFKVVLDDQHIAWWSQYQPNGGTDTRGFRYWLKDKMWTPVSNGETYRGHPVAARNREEFESVLVANLHRIPSDGELEQRKLDDERKEENRKVAQDAATTKYRMEQAAPEMLSALKASLLEHEAIHEVTMLNPVMRGTKPPAIIATIRAAISKAEDQAPRPAEEVKANGQ